MKKRTASLFMLSFVLLALCICVVPAYIQTDNKLTIQAVLLILAIGIDLAALRTKRKSLEPEVFNGNAI